MRQYHNLIQTIFDKGTRKKPAREGMPGTISIFGHQEVFELSEGFPLLTTKKMYWKGIVAELLWFLRGDVNIKYLDEHGVTKMWHQDAFNYYVNLVEKGSITILTSPLDFESFCKRISETAREKLGSINLGNGEKYVLGDCGFQYGRVWRRWAKSKYHSIDQIEKVIKSIIANPEGRRHIVSAIDPGHDQELALYWCHAMFQFNCREIPAEERTSLTGDAKYYLDLMLTQRSGDSCLGIGFNIASYALLNHIIAKICNMVPGRFIHSMGDVHIYDNHIEPLKEQLTRDVNRYKLPTVRFSENIDWNHIRNTSDFSLLKVEDFILENYEFYPAIKAELSTGLKK